MQNVLIIEQDICAVLNITYNYILSDDHRRCHYSFRYELREYPVLYFPVLIWIAKAMR